LKPLKSLCRKVRVSGKGVMEEKMKRKRKRMENERK